MPSHLLHEPVILKDQVCPGSNKDECFVTHPLFVIYKPDPLDHAACLSPPPSCRLATSIIVQWYPNKVRMSTMALAHPLVG